MLKTYDTEPRIVTQEELDSKGYDSMVDMLRDEWADQQGPSASFYDGLDGTNSLNIGLNEHSQAIFRESAFRAIIRPYPDMRKESDS